MSLFVEDIYASFIMEPLDKIPLKNDRQMGSNSSIKMEIRWAYELLWYHGNRFTKLYGTIIKKKITKWEE